MSEPKYESMGGEDPIVLLYESGEALDRPVLERAARLARQAFANRQVFAEVGDEPVYMTHKGRTVPRMPGDTDELLYGRAAGFDVRMLRDQDEGTRQLAMCAKIIAPEGAGHTTQYFVPMAWQQRPGALLNYAPVMAGARDQDGKDTGMYYNNVIFGDRDTSGRECAKILSSWAMEETDYDQLAYECNMYLWQHDQAGDVHYLRTTSEIERVDVYDQGVSSYRAVGAPQRALRVVGVEFFASESAADEASDVDGYVFAQEIDTDERLYRAKLDDPHLWLIRPSRPAVQ